MLQVYNTPQIIKGKIAHTSDNMTKEDIKTEYNALEEKHQKVSLERLISDFDIYVKPYLGFITSIRTKEGRPNEQKIRKVLQVTHNTWDTLKKLPTFKEYLDLENDYMKYQARKAVVDLVRESPNAKAVELQLKVFDDEFGSKKVDGNSLPQKIRVDLFDARMEEEDIHEKAGIDDSEFE